LSYRVVALVPDAFGGRGGIALYNRMLLRAICSCPDVIEVIALPRKVSYAVEAMPANLRYEMRSVGGKLRYAAAVLALGYRVRQAELVICGHLHLLPVARFLAWRFGCPMLPVVYGREAWDPTPRRIVNRMCSQLSAFIAMRMYTAECLKNWAGIRHAKTFHLPNGIELADYGVAPRRSDLVAKYGLVGRTVVMTAGRIDTEEEERNKGFDEVLETLPLLACDLPDVVYLIMGDGDGRPWLEEKARALGVADRVIFTGYVPEKEKADHYRLADVVAMPGSNPRFDRYPFRFAFLEALACGVPVVTSRLEDPSEIGDPDARAFLIQVDPQDRVDIKRGILAALVKRGQGINPALHNYGYGAFESRVFSILAHIRGQT
jgi:glycosyltransferase involved in cell wall biosynthesis